MLTSSQQKTAEAIVNIFETSAVLGDYSCVTVLEGDTGHLTYGRSQTTLGSGNLFVLLQRYCANAGARFASKMTPWLQRVQAKDIALDRELLFHNLLRACADDPVMRDTQDAFFADTYWQPAARAAANFGITTPLGVAVVYDSTVHGSWPRMRDRTVKQAGTLVALGEREWIRAYVTTRREWLANNSNALLCSTVYRMDAFMALINQNYWGLDLPLVVRSEEISLATLNATPPHCYDAPLPGSRALTLQSPMARGLDVRLLQLALSENGLDIKADGVFGQTSFARLKAYQTARGLPATGIAEPALILELLNA